MRNFILVAAIVAISASVPAILESNPQLIENLKNANSGKKATEVIAPASHKKLKKPKPVVIKNLVGRRVKMPMDAMGHFSGRFKLNGREINSLVDTGATLVAINRTTARRIGLKLMPSDFKYKVNTANGTARAAAAKIATMQIGRIYLKDVDAMVLEDRALDNTLIGMSFLNRLNKFRVENQTLYLEQ